MNLHEVERQIKVETVTAVIRLLEQRDGILTLGFTLPDGLSQRLRIIRGRLHNCSPNDWGPYLATQAGHP